MLHSIAKLDSRLQIISTIEETDVITVVVFVESKSATCPQCHEVSNRAHSHYTRVIDDFAWKKGHRYGILICDGLTHQPIDVLPDREKETLEKWFKQHPTIQKVTRDRFIRFQEVLEDIPSITQIHNRFHLIQNLWGLHDKAVRKILPYRIEKKEKAIPSKTYEIPLTKSEKERIENVNQKWNQALQIKELKKQGYSIQKISRMLGIDRRTVKKYMEMESPPCLKRKKRRKPLDAFQQEVINWETQGLTVDAMYQQLKEKSIRDY